jgi:hypothetical protein
MNVRRSHSQCSFLEVFLLDIEPNFLSCILNRHQQEGECYEYPVTGLTNALTVTKLCY